jgi:hypothetical protein
VTENDRSSRSDPIADFQRWVMRSSAKNLSREIKGTFRRTLGGGQDSRDVWETATTEPPPVTGEAPECAWCPICRAARRVRESGPGLANQVAGAGDALLSMAQDTVAAFEATLSTRPPAAEHKSPAGTGWPAEPTPAAAPVAHERDGETGGVVPDQPPTQPSGEGQKAPDGPDHRP